MDGPSPWYVSPNLSQRSSALRRRPPANSFGLQFFLYVPAWIYLIGTPRFERTRKYANPVAMFAVDVVCTILALSAFASQASYNSKDLCGTRCGISKSIVAIGVLVT